MKTTSLRLPHLLLFIALRVLLLAPPLLLAEEVPPAIAPSATENAQQSWTSANVEHAYGFPDVKPGTKGKLTLSRNELTFQAGTLNLAIPRESITAASAGDDRVELWGTGGRIMRMVIPDGGGLAAGAVMHHRVDMLTVEFTDDAGGRHASVFYLPAHEATQALAIFRQLAYAVPRKPAETCVGNFEAASVVVREPDWDRVEVPAAYRALLYEHVIDRLRQTKGVSHVYRDGETIPNGACPQYTIRTSIQAFKKGNQVKRAAMGPVGMFAGATEMSFDVAFSDAGGQLHAEQQIRAAVRSDTESTTVANKVAKKLAKHFQAALKTAADQQDRQQVPRS